MSHETHETIDISWGKFPWRKAHGEKLNFGTTSKKRTKNSANKKLLVAIRKEIGEDRWWKKVRPRHTCIYVAYLHHGDYMLYTYTMYIYFWHSVQLRLIVLHKKGGKTLEEVVPTFAETRHGGPLWNTFCGSEEHISLRRKIQQILLTWLLTNQRKLSLKNPIKDPSIWLSFWGSVMLQTEFLGELCRTGEFNKNHICHN